ncbi:hypothetical protein CsSME_00012370 [Camellia sinensis var. sinensis]
MTEYLTQIKEISDQLRLASSTIDDEDLVLLTLNGLPEEYDALKTTIRARVESITMDDLCSLLSSEEIHVENKARLVVSASPVAYATTKGSEISQSSPHYAKSHFTNPSSYRGQGQFRGYRGGRNRGGRFYKPHRGRFTSTNNNGCQICGGYNHSAFDCWWRMDPNFQPLNSNSSSQSSPHGVSQPHAYSVTSAPTTSSSASSTPWYIDSVATNHITNDLTNLHLYQPYQGQDQVTVGQTYETNSS